MKVDNYAVAMNAQYFNLQLESTQTKVSNINQNFSNDTSSEINNISINETKTLSANNELTRELSSAVLKNLYGEKRRLVGDRVEITSDYVEAQGLNFAMKAFVQAQDKEIEVDLNVSLSRTFVQHTKLTVDLLQEVKDPLVISLNGAMPSLSSKTFSFDIDSDGETDQISKLNSGNGFLALDKNYNGSIDDGSELFGTKSGDGFSDLSKYDDDKNGWIDENDSIFNKLRIWEKTDSKDELVALGEVGIGAIFLGNTTTPFSLKSESKELLGEIRSSSFVLYENGKAGVISQIDMAITTKTKDDLEIVDSLKKDNIKVQLPKLYSNETSQESDDTPMGKLQGRLKELEAKLSKAPEHEKASIQAQIGLIYAQMMDLIDTN